MAIQTIVYLKSRFETGDFPTEQDFIDLIDTLNAGGGGNPISGSESGITSLGTNQATAKEVTKKNNRVDTVADGTGVKSNITATVGFYQTVQNKGANDLLYYPFLGNNFLGQAANVPIVISSGNQASVFCYNDGELTLI